MSHNEDHPLRPATKGVETTLAVLSAVLLIITYAALIGPGTRLSSTSKLPLASMEANIGALLSKAWPDTNASVDFGIVGRGNDNSDAIRLLYLGKMDDDGKQKVARGVEQCEAVQGRAIVAPPIWLTTGSSLTKSMVQLAIWEWVSIWMVVAMIACTLAFNGFLSTDRGPDSYPRLVVVMIYASGYCFHAWYVWRTCKNFFTLVGAGSTWSLLNRAGFASVDREQLRNRVLDGGPEPGFKQVGKPASASAYPAFDAYLAHENPGGTGRATAPTARKAEELQRQQQNRGVDDTVNDWHRAEGASTIEAGRTALERVATNAMTIVGIIVTSGFAAWTSNPTSESSQLGSLALLASLSLGTAAMFSSAVEMSVMETSFRNFLFHSWPRTDHQKYGINYKETFAPVAKYMSIRLLEAIKTIESLTCEQMDFVAAYLNGRLKDLIYYHALKKEAKGSVALPRLNISLSILPYPSVVSPSIVYSPDTPHSLTRLYSRILLGAL